MLVEKGRYLRIKSMFFVLSKTVGLLVKPLSWLIILLIIALLARSKRLKRISLITSVSFLLIFTNPFFLNVVLNLWEPKPVAISSLPEYDIGILLGGFSRHFPISDNITLTRSGDRLWQTLALYKHGKIKKILISGGSFTSDKPESKAVYDALISIGLPDSVIMIEDKSLNTRQNAIYTVELLKQNNNENNYLVPEVSTVIITSAFHMQRSLGCFRKAGLSPESFPVGHLTRHDNVYWARWFRPEPEALRYWELLFNEWAGIVMYKLMGYI